MVWLALAPLAAQQRAPGVPGVFVSGIVVDQTGAVLPNARVEVKNASGATVQALTADQVGAFQLAPLPSGRYDLVATFEGFEPTTVRLTIGTRARRRRSA